MKTLKSLGLFAIILFSSVAQAHDYSGDLGQEKAATDFHAISCGSGTDTLFFDLISYDASSSDTLVTASVISGNAFSVTDPISTDVNKSIGIDVPTTDGVLLLIGKNKAGRVGYTIDFHCEGGGEHTETDLNTLQNQ